MEAANMGGQTNQNNLVMQGVRIPTCKYPEKMTKQPLGSLLGLISLRRSTLGQKSY